METDGKIEVVCEFCGKKYVYTKDDLADLTAPLVRENAENPGNAEKPEDSENAAAHAASISGDPHAAASISGAMNRTSGSCADETSGSNVAQKEEDHEKT